MGYTEVLPEYRPPAWIANYSNLTHCSKCDAVYSKNTKFVKAREIRNGTSSPRFEYERDCKQDCCPICEC